MVSGHSVRLLEWLWQGVMCGRSWRWWKPVQEVSIPIQQFAITLLCGAV